MECSTSEPSPPGKRQSHLGPLGFRTRPTLPESHFNEKKEVSAPRACPGLAALARTCGNHAPQENAPSVSAEAPGQSDGQYQGTPVFMGVYRAFLGPAADRQNVPELGRPARRKHPHEEHFRTSRFLPATMFSPRSTVLLIWCQQTLQVWIPLYLIPLKRPGRLPAYTRWSGTQP